MTKNVRILSAVLSAAMVTAPSANVQTANENYSTTDAPVIYESAATTAEEELTMTNPSIQEDAIIADSTEEELAPPVAIDITEEVPEFDIGPAICTYFVKPGDMKMFGHTQLGFEHYCKVTETADGTNITLSGWSIGTGDWTYSMLADGTPNAYRGTLPFVVNTGEAFLAPPLAATMVPFELEGFSIEASKDKMVSYYPAPGGYYLFGDDWKAAIVDYTRYSEIKYGPQNGNLDEDYCNMSFVARAGDYWAVASSNAPKITVATTEKAPTDPFYEKVAEATFATQGITDPKYGAIQWDEFVREECNGSSSVYRLGGKLNGMEFEVEIDDGDAIGFANQYSWSAAIVPANVVSQHNPCVLHVNGYTLNTDLSKTTYVYNEATGEGHSVPCNIANDEIVLVTVTDGKHATVMTFDLALLGYIWSLSR